MKEGHSLFAMNNNKNQPRKRKEKSVEPSSSSADQSTKEASSQKISKANAGFHFFYDGYILIVHYYLDQSPL